VSFAIRIQIRAQVSVVQSLCCLCCSLVRSLWQSFFYGVSSQDNNAVTGSNSKVCSNKFLKANQLLEFWSLTNNHFWGVR